MCTGRSDIHEIMLKMALKIILSIKHLHRFQQYFSHITATGHIINVFPGFHQHQAGTLKCLAQGHSHEKNQRIQCGSNPGLIDYESNTLPQSHAAPIASPWMYNTKQVPKLLWIHKNLPCVITDLVTKYSGRLACMVDTFCRSIHKKSTPPIFFMEDGLYAIVINYGKLKNLVNFA